MRTETELEHEQLVKGMVKSVNANWKRNKMWLIECLIGTAKENNIYQIGKVL